MGGNFLRLCVCDTTGRMVERIPALIAAACLAVYWFWVVVKLIQLGHKLRKDPNALPRERVGQWMRVAWYPCIAALLAGLMVAAFVPEGRMGRWPVWARVMFGRLWPGESGGVLVVVGVASSAAVVCTVFTFVCWRKMGRSWRIGIDPGETLAIVSTGPYRYVRHPIYALRMVINICAFIMATRRRWFCWRRGWTLFCCKSRPGGRNGIWNPSMGRPIKGIRIRSDASFRGPLSCRMGGLADAVAPPPGRGSTLIRTPSDSGCRQIVSASGSARARGFGIGRHSGGAGGEPLQRGRWCSSMRFRY